MVADKNKQGIWALGAGRCMMEGCNADLIFDRQNKRESPKYGWVAHIIADKEDGPRGDPALSPKLADDISNLMLLCADCHRRIDHEDTRDEFTVERLRAIKQAREEYIQLLMDLEGDRRSHILLYGANIGKHSPVLNWNDCVKAVLPDRVPASTYPIRIQVSGSKQKDDGDHFWNAEPLNLSSAYDQEVGALINQGAIEHISLFALAPIPLLVRLGHLLGEVVPVEVHHRSRNPAGWVWREGVAPVNFTLREPEDTCSKIALTFSVSGSVTDQRVCNVLGADTSVWALSVPEPNNDIIRTKEDRENFKASLREALNKIKARHGQGNGQEIHVFSALPACLAVELGRVWMPKVDLPMQIYDHTQQQGDVARLSIK